MANFLRRLFEFPFNMRQRRLAQSRRSLSEAQFVALVTDQGGDGSAATRLWNALQDWKCYDSFTPYPNDSLGFVFGIAEEELDELVLGILRELKVETSQATFTEFGAIDTPLQLAAFVALCRSRMGNSDPPG